jgi:DNA-directed RNA polymerase specialized sigma24 family protein
MKGHGSKFGRKKEAAIAALLAERNLAEAARVVGIDLSTLKRWLRRPRSSARSTGEPAAKSWSRHTPASSR